MVESFRPLDVNKIRDIVRQESARLNLRSYASEGESSFTLSLALSAAIKKIFFEKSEMTFSSEPALSKSPIVQFGNRMRVDAMEKFNSTTAFAAVQFAANEEDLARKEYMLTLLVYMEQRFLPEFMRLMQYPYIEFEEEDEVRDGVGTMANLIAGQYKREMGNLGYRDLMMSHFESYINTTAEGIGIPKGVTEKYEIAFEIEGTRRLAVELVTLDMLPRWKITEAAEAKKILLIDDDLTLITAVEPFLKSQGFHVIVARDGEEGIRKLRDKPHLVILDIMMPVMDGYEFVLEKRKIEGDKQSPVIVLTAKEGMADMFKVEGAREYLLKPFQPAALLKSIQRCI